MRELPVNPLDIIPPCRVQEQDKRLAFGAELTREGRSVECFGIDRLVEPSIFVDALADDVQRAVGGRNEREVASQDCIAIGHGGYEGRGGRVCECGRIIDDVQESTIPLLCIVWSSASASR